MGKAEAPSGYPLHVAQRVLSGPPRVSVGIDFYGEPSLTLRSEEAALISGVMRSRIVYAYLAYDDEQQVILKEAEFDARSAHRTTMEDFRMNGRPSIACPTVSVRYVWCDVQWLRSTLSSLHGLAIPLDPPVADSGRSGVYTLQVYRPDGTRAEASWRVGTRGRLGKLSAWWESTWQQMSGLLEEGAPVEPEEGWSYDGTPNYVRVPQLAAGADRETKT